MSEEIEVGSTKEGLEDFLESVIWNDIKNELMAWKKGFSIELEGLVDTIAAENPSTASVLTHLGDLNGRIKAVDYMLQLPEIFISLVEEKEDGDRRHETD